MSRGATARLFAAIELPAAVRERLTAWTRAAFAGLREAGGSRAALRALEEDSLHLTLCFLGERPVGEIAALSAALAALRLEACELALGAPLWLPPRRPRALAVEVHDFHGELAGVQERVSAALAGAGAWSPERRRFRAHVTLARVRGGGRAERGAGAASRGRPTGAGALPATPRLSFTPEAVVLYRSWLGQRGASYEPLAAAALAPPGR
ncbi:MAG TPA: RNA 2',3'-cyclic phosphodiesterase [Solirubrobacteraceae bacterium]|nr:RNA 2',3'-cyclic phosphodiesterase [Solirubrobacteraceae bacterium]